MSKIQIDEKFIELIETRGYTHNCDINPFGYIPGVEPFPGQYLHPREVGGLSEYIKQVYLKPNKVLKTNPFYPPNKNKSPYEFFGDYNIPMRIDLIIWLLKMALKGQKLKGDQIYCIEDLDYLLKRYAEWFVKGFNDFEEKQIDSFLMNPNDTIEKAEKIVEFIFDNKELYVDKPNTYISLRDAGLFMGLREGSKYKAWSFILNRERLFEPIFKKFTKTLNNKTEKDEPSSFRELFQNVSDYKDIVKILGEKGYINPQSLVWIDENKGAKGLIGAIIKDLHSKGYFTKKPTSNDIKIICENTFKCEIGLDTIKRSKPEKHNLNFIPHSN